MSASSTDAGAANSAAANVNAQPRLATLGKVTANTSMAEMARLMHHAGNTMTPAQLQVAIQAEAARMAAADAAGRAAAAAAAQQQQQQFATGPGAVSSSAASSAAVTLPRRTEPAILDPGHVIPLEAYQNALDLNAKLLSEWYGLAQTHKRYGSKVSAPLEVRARMSTLEATLQTRAKALAVLGDSFAGGRNNLARVRKVDVQNCIDPRDVPDALKVAVWDSIEGAAAAIKALVDLKPKPLSETDLEQSTGGAGSAGAAGLGGDEEMAGQVELEAGAGTIE